MTIDYAAEASPNTTDDYPPFARGDCVRLKINADFDAEFREGVELGAVGIVTHLGGIMSDDVWVDFGGIILECDPAWLETAPIN